MNKIVVLAAGKGTRMNSDLPKVLVPLNGKPMIQHLVKAINESGVNSKPILVVSPDNKGIIKKALGEYDCEYAIQDKQLGTGHALNCARQYLELADKIICLYGDHPFISPTTIKKLADYPNGVITMMTTAVDSFEGWQNNFYHWGRIVRQAGKIKEIVEFKDASDEIRKIKEINPALYRFDSQWLWQNIDRLTNQNAQHEYYLTDLIKLAFEQNQEITSVSIGLKEAMGINSKEELKIAEDLC